jgi:hypothetical protein
MFNVLMCEVIVRFVDICRIVGHQFIIMEAIVLGWTLKKIKTFTVITTCLVDIVRFDYSIAKHSIIWFRWFGYY